MITIKEIIITALLSAILIFAGSFFENNQRDQMQSVSHVENHQENEKEQTGEIEKNNENDSDKNTDNNTNNNANYSDDNTELKKTEFNNTDSKENSNKSDNFNNSNSSYHEDNTNRAPAENNYNNNSNNERNIESTNTNPKYIKPVTGRISSPFGPRWGSFHYGIDFAVPAGTPVKASREGMVILSEWVNGYGKTVVIEHSGGVRTLYAHNDTLLVRGGQQVAQGEKIALSGNTGISTGPHLHFEIQKNGEPVDPINYLN